MTELEADEALHSLLHAYKRALRDACRAADIDWPPSHIRTMKALSHAAPCSAHDLGLRMRRDKAQVARLLQDLMAAGLVKRQRDPQDARRYILTRTRAGRQFCERVAGAQQAATARMLRGLPAASVDEFVRIAETMTHNLDSPETT